jgi:phosphoglucosamine mutase
VLQFGVITTPAVALLTKQFHLDAGIVISASHNPAQDNGIKYFLHLGQKLDLKAEKNLETALHSTKALPHLTGTQVGFLEHREAQAIQWYTDFMLRHYGSLKNSRIKLCVDLAHGAACRTVPSVFAALGLLYQSIADQPDGLNINDRCGSLYPQKIARWTQQCGAQVGLAFDGDGDRVMLIDEKGQVHNGDRILGILATHYARQGRLPHQTVVGTVMSNLGLELFLKQHRISLIRTTVGDKYVAEQLHKHHLVLGGEQSGHILLPRLLSTGDGLLTALEVLRVMTVEKKPLSILAGGWKDFPQILINVLVSKKIPLTDLPVVQKAIHQVRVELGDRGRVNVRYSGTERLARVMVEAEARDHALRYAQIIAETIQKTIGTAKPRTITWLTSA